MKFCKMHRFITIGLCLMLLAACNTKVNTYANKRGVKPAALAEMDIPNYTQIEWLDTLKNFGSIKEGDSVLIQFRFKNRGETVLFILEAIPSCGCTVTNYPQNAILPGDQGAITATFSSNEHPGSTTKSILVKTNTVNKKYQKLEFNGVVIKLKDGSE